MKSAGVPSLMPFAVCLFMSATAMAQAPACNSAAHRAFDFWVGEWQVHGANGKLVGTNIYDASRKVWHQTWTDSSGLLLMLEGGLQDGKMVLEGKGVDAAGAPVNHRITWSPNADGSVRQHWESTNAAGQWSTAFDGKYTRK